MASMIRLSSTAPPRPRSSKAVLATVAPAPIAMPQGEQPAKSGAKRRRRDASRPASRDLESNRHMVGGSRIIPQHLWISCLGAKHPGYGGASARG